MRPYDIKTNIIRLLSSARKPDEPRHTLAFSSRQICDRLEGLLPPNQNPKTAENLIMQVRLQLDRLEGEFEIVSKAESRKLYRIAPPTLIIVTDKPLRAKYVGDRAYFDQVVELISAVGDINTQVIESGKSAAECRDILEARGISVQKEEQLFEFLPSPALPTQIDISMAEHLAVDEVSGAIEAYVPRRADFFSSRWTRLNEARPSDMSQLRRIKERTRRIGRSSSMYAWETNGKLYRINRDQALLAMYHIDIIKNAVRLLDLNKAIPSENVKEFKDLMPTGFDILVARYTEPYIEDVAVRFNDDDRPRFRESLRVVPGFKNRLLTLLEQKLGINKPLY